MKRLWLVLMISVMAIFSTGCSTVISLAQQVIQAQQQAKQQPVAKKEQDKPKKEQAQQQNEDDLSDIAQAPNNQDDDPSLDSDDSSGQEDPEDKNIQVDGRTWTPVDVHAQNDGNVRVLYVPEGQSADDWTEAITIDVHKGLQNQATVNDYAMEMRKSINEQVRDGKVTWRTLSKQQDDLMYEFVIENDGYQDNQHEISRVVATDEEIIVLHYTNKLSVPMSEDERQKWIQILQEEDPSSDSSDDSSDDPSDGSTTDDSSDSDSSDTL